MPTEQLGPFNQLHVPQPQDHHPEGDAGIHTLLVLDQAAKLSPDRVEQCVDLLRKKAASVSPSQALKMVEAEVEVRCAREAAEQRVQGRAAAAQKRMFEPATPLERRVAELEMELAAAKAA